MQHVITRALIAAAIWFLAYINADAAHVGMRIASQSFEHIGALQS
jgi:hypothetical protein